jgi:hypothetical protein
MDGEPFIANYAVAADVLQPQIVNNLDSAMGSAANIITNSTR